MQSVCVTASLNVVLTSKTDQGASACAADGVVDKIVLLSEVRRRRADKLKAPTHGSCLVSESMSLEVSIETFQAVPNKPMVLPNLVNTPKAPTFSLATVF